MPGRSGTCPTFLPVELHADLDLPGQSVLRRYRRGTDYAERAAGGAGVIVRNQAVEVVVEHVERLEAKLNADALSDVGHLEQRGVELERMLPANLAGAERIVAGRVAGGCQPRVV